MSLDKAFQEGRDSWDKYVASGWTESTSNPYIKGSSEFLQWRRGWNTMRKIT